MASPPLKLDPNFEAYYQGFTILNHLEKFRDLYPFSPPSSNTSRGTKHIARKRKKERKKKPNKQEGAESFTLKHTRNGDITLLFLTTDILTQPPL